MFTLFRWMYRIIVYGVLLPGFLFGFVIGVYSAIYPDRGAGSRLDNPYLTIKTLDEAVRAVYVERQTIEGQRQFCAATQDEKIRFIADGAPIIWWSSNNKAVVAVNSYLATGDGAKIAADTAPVIAAAVAKFQTDSAADRDKACLAAAQAIIDHKRDVATEGPGVAKLLADYSAKDPASGRQLFREDYTIGCIKGALKERKLDYAAATKFCPCILDIIETNLSESERKELWEVDQGDISKLSQSQLQRIAPKIATQCRSSAQPAGAK